jgi:hypothetical protein
MFGYACVRVSSGGRVAVTPVPVQVHANARSTETTLGSRAHTTLKGHAGYNDLAPDQFEFEILPNFSSMLKVHDVSTIYNNISS